MASGKDNLPINSDREKNGTEPLALVRGVGSGLAGEGTPGSGPGRGHSKGASQPHLSQAAVQTTRSVKPKKRKEKKEILNDLISENHRV